MGTDEEVLPPEIEDRLRRGLELLAAETPAPGAVARRRGLSSRLPAITLGAAAALAAVLAGPALVNGLGSNGGTSQSAESAPSALSDGFSLDQAAPGMAADDAAAPKLAQDPDEAAREESAPLSADMTAPAPAYTGPESSAGVAGNADRSAGTSNLVAYDLPMLVAESQRIVVGTVTDVQQGAASDASGGMPYVMATVKVTDALRGLPGRVFAFDYSYGGEGAVAGGPQGATFAVGERVLLFLSDPTGTVHEGVEPKHWQVSGGAQGAFAMDGAEPGEFHGMAPFTLADVRAEIARHDAG